MVSIRQTMQRGAVVCVIAVLAASTANGQDPAMPSKTASATSNFNGAAHELLTQTYDLWSFLLDKWYPADGSAAPVAPGAASAFPNTTAVGSEGAGRVVPPNPFSGADFYVNSDYAKEVTKSLAKVQPSSNDAKKMRTLESVSTAVWLDRIDAIAGGVSNSGRLSLKDHLSAALRQAKSRKRPVVLPLVIYDLPNRDCAALASNGELQGAQGLADYKKKFIDVIVSTLAKYNNQEMVRIAAIIEPDSLPNLVTNLGIPACAEVNSKNYYIDGVTYAIQQLGSLPNVAIYLDMGHSGWLGWTNNMQAAVSLYSTIIKKAERNGDALVRGVATDIANYTPTVEPYLRPTNQTILSGNFYQWNPAFDENTFVGLVSKAFADKGISGMGFVIDTSRNGWAQRNDGKPIDGRKDRANWCNVRGAGMGALPRATPSVSLPIDAFAWVKPPGESDGSSKVTVAGNKPDKEGKRFDPSCDANNPRLDALPNAPPAGQWFHTQFLQLLRNAQPPISLTAPRR